MKLNATSKGWSHLIIFSRNLRKEVIKDKDWSYFPQKKKDWSYFIILTVCLLNEFDKHTKCDMILFFEKQLVT